MSQEAFLRRGTRYYEAPLTFPPKEPPGDVEKLSQSERMRLSNKEAWTQWAVDVTKSPYDLP